MRAGPLAAPPRARGAPAAPNAHKVMTSINSSTALPVPETRHLAVVGAGPVGLALAHRRRRGACRTPTSRCSTAAPIEQGRHARPANPGAVAGQRAVAASAWVPGRTRASADPRSAVCRSSRPRRRPCWRGCFGEPEVRIRAHERGGADARCGAELRRASSRRCRRPGSQRQRREPERLHTASARRSRPEERGRRRRARRRHRRPLRPRRGGRRRRVRRPGAQER